MKSVPRKLQLFLDPISPYAYLALHHLRALGKRTPIDIEVVPTLFAGLLNAHGQKGPAEIASKRRHIFLDCTRSAKLLKIPFRLPPAHPYNPLLPLRLLTSIESPPDRLKLTEAILSACWGQGKNVSQRETLFSVAEEACGSTITEHLFKKVEDPLVKTKLKSNTDYAISSGIFGVPTVLVTDSKELFWGSDRIDHLEQYLAGNLNIDYPAFDDMLNVPRGADRRNVELR
jgi:2-hydroxychromene-2-carboxylate isomerase